MRLREPGLPDPTDAILENPHKFGLPTFQEFCRDPGRWVGRDDDRFANIDRGSSLLNRYVKRHVYFVEGVRCRSLEHAQTVASGMGLGLKDLEYTAEAIPDVGLKCDVHVRFFKRGNVAKRRAW